MVSKKKQKSLFVNDNVLVNEGFDITNLTDVSGDWRKMKGRILEGKWEGMCEVLFLSGDKLYCMFKKGLA